MNKYKCVLFSIFFIVFITSLEIFSETKYFSPTGEEITKEKYDEIAAEHKNKINQKEKLKEAQEKTPTIETIEKVQSKYTSQGYDMFGKPTNDPSQYDCKGRPHYNKNGNRLSYPDACDGNSKISAGSYPECINKMYQWVGKYMPKKSHEKETNEGVARCQKQFPDWKKKYEYYHLNANWSSRDDI